MRGRKRPCAGGGVLARVTQHGPHLTQITRLLTNCYLVREDDGLTLIDCLWPGAAGLVLSAAKTTGQSVRRIVLTHAHHDHTGSLERLHATLPDAELMVGAREALLLRGDLRHLPGEPAGRLRRSIYRRRRVEPDRLLAAGDRVGSLQVVDAKGHTPGQLAFLDTRDATLICGDAFLTIGDPFVCTEPVARFPVPALVGLWHRPSAIATARRLLDSNPQRLASGHGRVVEQPAELMATAFERALAR